MKEDNKEEVRVDSKISKHLNFGRAFVCSFSFFGLYMALFPAQNIQAALFERDNFGSLGFYSNAITYLGQALGSLFCIFIMEKLGNIKTIAWGSVLCILFVASLIIPAIKSEDLESDNFFLSKNFVYPVMLLTSTLTGFGEGMAHPGASKFITDCTTEETKGFYYAFFWSFYMGSQVFGNLLAAFVLGSFDQRFYVIIITSIGSLACIMLFFMKPPIIQEQERVMTNYVMTTKSVKPLLVGSSIHYQTAQSQYHHRALSMNSRGALAPIKSVHSFTSYQGEKVTIGGVLASMWKLCKDKRFLHMVPQFCWTGISIAYYSGLLVVMMTESINGDNQTKFKYSMCAMALLGVGEVIGCFVIGFIVDKFGSKKAILCNLVLISMMMSSTIVFIIMFEFNYMAWIMCFLWGFTDSAINTNTQEMVGFEFDNDSEPFSVANIFQCVANFTFQIIVSFLKGKDEYLYFTIGCTAIALLSIGMTYFFPFRENKSNNTQMQMSMGPKLDLSQPDYNPNSYHGNPNPLKISTNQDPLLSSSEVDDEPKKDKKSTDKNNGKKAPNKSQNIDDTTLSFE